MSNENKDTEKRAGQWGPRQAQNTDLNRQWAALRRRYEWNDSYDDGIAPKDEALEKELFGEENHINTGINFKKYDNIKVTAKGGEKIEPISRFEEANLHEVMKENIRLAAYEVPTPVQKYSIPVITENYDLMACAQTGSGKTAAFLIPILSRLFGKAKKLAAPRPTQGSRKFKAEPLVLIIAPTRELATQIFDECRRFCYRSMMRPCVVYGGAETIPQKDELAKGCDVLTATPGRLNDFLDRGIISLRRVKFLVLDEADRMLDMGFEPEIRKIVQKSDILDDGTRQTLMFSATFPKSIRSLAKDFLADNHIFLTVGRVGGTTSDITQKIMYVEDQDKRNQLVQLLLQQPPSRTLIFVETKRGADSLDDFLFNQNFPTTSIHGDRSQREREDALISFKNGLSPILIATAVAARGLDIKNVMHVINYDLCKEIDEYVHRIGRTARVGNKGLATTFYNERNVEIAPDLVKILIECNQEVPDFLKYVVNTEDLKFDDDDDDRDTAPPRNNYNNRGSKNNNNNNDYGNWGDNSQNQTWNNNNNNNQNQKQTWDSSNPPWENNPQSQPQQLQSQPVSNDTWSQLPSSQQSQQSSYQTQYPQQPTQGPPQQVLPPQYNTPQYNSPQPQYNISQPQYNAPQPQYNAPQPQYNSPQPQYNSPQPQYNSPQPQFNTQSPPIVNLPKNQLTPVTQTPSSHNSQSPPQQQQQQQNFVAAYTPNGNNNNNNNNNPGYGNNNDANRNNRRPHQGNVPPPGSDGWGTQENMQTSTKPWNAKETPWG
ncbi:hypothetical protein Glove_709g44 [Diversispora epigaea]|uniref:ATP-dependent RNA helicase DED1 n=1 Tax=Diversispora epigaea TaxID=1348612 RepID=A0A397G2F7_9GLOM|nr:hypothetical protein Glove_709g44 [Diversispora epigaea]